MNQLNKLRVFASSRDTVALQGSSVTLLMKSLMVGLGCCLLVSCGDEAPPEEGELSEVVVVDGRGVTVEELKDYLASRPGFVSVGATNDALKELIDEMVVAEVLAREAQRIGIGEDPEVRRAIRQFLTQRLLEERVVKPVMERKIADAELRAYFDLHRADYAWPEQVRLADVFIAQPEDATEAEREEKRQHAEQVLEEARVARRDRRGLGALIQVHSDKHPS